MQTTEPPTHTPSLDWQHGIATFLCDELKLVPKPPALIPAGMIHFQAVELVKEITLLGSELLHGPAVEVGELPEELTVSVQQGISWLTHEPQDVKKSRQGTEHRSLIFVGLEMFVVHLDTTIVEVTVRCQTRTPEQGCVVQTDHEMY